MAATKVRESFRARSFSYSDSATNTREFIVETDDVSDGPVVAALADLTGTGGLAVPRKGTVRTVGGIALTVTSVKADPRDNSDTVYTVIVEETADAPQFSASDDPLERPPEVEWGFVNSTEPTYVDRDGAVIANSAGETFDPPVERSYNDPALRVTQNLDDFDVAQAIDFQDAINTAPFWGAAPGTAKVHSRTGSRRYENGAYYWQVVTEVHFRRDGWRTKVKDQGFYFLLGDDRVLMRDASGAPVNAPVDLDGTGALLHPGNDPVFLEFDLYPERDFAELQIDHDDVTPA